MAKARREELEKELKAGRSNEFMKLKVGKNRVRFLPRDPKWKSHIKIIHEHFVDDIPGKTGSFRFACPRRHGAGARCPECERGDVLRRGNNVVDRERAKDHYPSTRNYSNVIDRSDEGSGPRIITFGSTIFDQLKAIFDDKADGGDYTNPGDEGFDIIITRTGTGKQDTKYAVSAARAQSALSEDQDEADGWMETMWSLDSYSAVLAADKLLDALAGEDSRGGRARAALPAVRSKGRTAQQDIKEEDDE